MSITKLASDTTVSSSGETINYTITVTNEGNQTLTNVTVSDGFVSNLVCDPGASVGPGGTVTCTASHDVTQLEIDGGGPIVNTATADSDQTDPEGAQASVAVTQSPELSITKLASPTTVSSSGETINYTITVTNEGNQTLTNVTVSDGFVSNLVCDPGASVGPGGTVTCTASHDVTQLEIDGGGPIVNTATADSDQTDPEGAQDRRAEHHEVGDADDGVVDAMHLTLTHHEVGEPDDGDA
ncbi:MAG: hypothetical protein R3D57_06835 [Hyphomicrobiaceae bacterium]